MKKLLSLALALALCLSLSVPALAANKTIYLKEESFGGPLIETAASEATFILSGDYVKKSTAKYYEYSAKDVPIYTFAGPVKVDVQVYTSSYNPRNIPLGSSAGSWTDSGVTCFNIGIFKTTYSQDKQCYENTETNAVFFEGQMEIYVGEENPKTEIVSIQKAMDPNTKTSPPTLASNATATVTEPGVYLVLLDCDGPSGTFLLEITGSSVPAAPSASGFTDVAASSPYAEAIKWAVDKKITTGKTATTFGPSDTCTVSHILTFLYRANGRPYASSGISDLLAAEDWAIHEDILSDTVNTNAPCTRAMAVSYLWKAAGSPAPAKSTAFADVPESADYAKAVSWAVEKGITNGVGGNTFSPGGTCTRGQIVTFLYRSMK